MEYDSSHHEQQWFGGVVWAGEVRNEEAVAKQEGTAYCLAVVRQTNTHVETAFVSDPGNTLKLTRQCRQWVWECSAYNYVPQQFSIG